MLYTNLKHIETAADYTRAISETENVVIVCGRMGVTCVPVYKIAEELEGTYKHVKFYDMEFDNPESAILRNVVEYYDLQNIPLTGYFKKGNLVEVSFGKQTKEQISAILNREYSKVEA
jgi:thioredoxin 1